MAIGILKVRISQGLEMQSAHIFFSIRYSKYNLSGFFGVQGFVLTVYQSDTSSESLKKEEQKLT